MPTAAKKVPKPKKEKAPERPARAWRLPQDGSLVVGAPYRKDFVTALKECVHHSERFYEEETRNWVISRTWADTALDLFREFYGDHGGEYWDNGWTPPPEPADGAPENEDDDPPF